MMLLGKTGGYKIIGEGNKLIEEKKAGGPDLRAHHQNFLAAIRGEAPLHADATTAHLSSSLCHLGNIAIQTGRHLRFDSSNEQMIGDEAANALLRRDYADHWSVPAGV